MSKTLQDTIVKPSTKGTALVTGVAQGIGRAIALRLADDGYDVALNDIASKDAAIDSTLAEITSQGRRGIAVPGDMSVEADVINLINRTVAELGALDVMIANAGILSLRPLSETSLDDWDSIFTVNARGTFLCYKHAAAQMIAQGRGGRIVGACSVIGEAGGAMMAAYSATKVAVRSLTQSAALEYGRHGITVNAYAPGANETAFPEQADSLFSFSAQLGLARAGRETLQATVSTGTNSTPEDIAGLVSYLASPAARFVNGARMLVVTEVGLLTYWGGRDVFRRIQANRSIVT